MKENNHAADTTTRTDARQVAASAGIHHRLSKLSEEVGTLLATKRHSAALMKLTDIVASAQEVREEPSYAVLQADALGWMGFIYRQMRRLDEAEAYIDEAIDILQVLQERHGNVSRSLAKAYVNKAANVLEHNRDDEADLFYDKALDLAEPLMDDPCLLVEIYYEGAMLFGEIEYIEDARQIVHTCDERAERMWLKKLDHLEKRLLAERQTSRNA